MCYNLQFGSYFTGGVIEQALKECAAPIDFRFGVENNPKIAEVYRQNHGDHILTADVRDVAPSDLPTVDWFHASPVCCRFSPKNHANRDDESDDHRENDTDYTTAQATAKFIREKKPRFVTVENVREYIGTRSYDVIASELNRSGYAFDVKVYEDYLIGGFTLRKRMILRATTERGAIFPKPKRDTSKVGKWIDFVEGCFEDHVSVLTEVRSKKAMNSINIPPRDIFRYEVEKDCIIDYMGNPNMCLHFGKIGKPMFTLCSSDSKTIGWHKGEEKYNEYHAMTSPRFFYRCHGIDNYKCDDIGLGGFICGNGIPRSFVENVMLPFVLQKGSGELSQGLLL